jgi:hypothetical protein
MFFKRFPRVALIPLLAFVAGIGIFVAPKPAHAATACSTWGCDNQYYSDTTCGQGSPVVTESNITIMYTGCGTNWAKISLPKTGPYITEVNITRRTWNGADNPVLFSPSGNYQYEACQLAANGGLACKNAIVVPGTLFDSVPIPQPPNQTWTWWTNMLYCPNSLNCQIQVSVNLSGNAPALQTGWH